MSPDRIKQQLRRLCTTGYDLGAKVNQDRDRALYDAARQHFGGWRDALAAAGINLANVTHRKPKNLDREAMLLWLRNRHSAQQTLVYTEVCLENRDYALAIRREFGSWAKAIDEATLAATQTKVSRWGTKTFIYLQQSHWPEDNTLAIGIRLH